MTGGIAGYLGRPQADTVLQAMARRLTRTAKSRFALHQSDMVFIASQDNETGVQAADHTHARLPSIDGGMIAAAFHGRLHNARALRQELAEKGHVFETDSDHELLLRLYREDGFNAVSRLHGSFVFALHDRTRDLVFIARDRLGVKGLYYTTTASGDFIFATEIKALFAHPVVRVQPDMIGIDAYLSLRYSPSPESMFKGVRKLQPGQYLIWNPGLHVHAETYWSWENFSPTSTGASDQDMQKQFDGLFDAAVKSRLPQQGGSILLSGGVSSSAVAASMARQATGAIDTFMVGYENEDEEIKDARAVATLLGARHHEIICHPGEMEKLPALIWAMDEPLGDAKIAAMNIAASLAAKQGDTVMTGAGADEFLFGRSVQKALLHGRHMPALKRALLKPMAYVAPDWLPQGLWPADAGARQRRKVLDFINAGGRQSLARQYHFLQSLFDRRDKTPVYRKQIAPLIDTFVDLQKDPSGWPTRMSSIIALQRDHWLPDGVLMPFEKITRAHNLDARMPFLDHHLVEFMLAAPDRLKDNGKADKVLLRNYLAPTLPGVAAQSKKTQRLPLQRYLESAPLKDMVEVCLSEKSVDHRGLFEYDAIRQIMARSKKGDVIYARQVFALLSLEIWFRIFIDNEKGWISY